jgi:hypothetical protein
MNDKISNTMEIDYRKLLEDHIVAEEIYKQQTTASLNSLSHKLDELTTSTQAIVDAYETAQQAIKISTFLGRAVKYIMGLILAYYALEGYIHNTK